MIARSARDTAAGNAGWRMVNICLIGVGAIGRMHAANVVASPRARLAGVVDVDRAAAAAVAADHGVTLYADVDAALGDDAVDAVMIAASSAFHAALIGKAVDAGKPVFCEKPLDLSLARANACVAALAGRAVPVLIGHHRRFDPHHRAVHDAVRAGDVGAVELVSITSRDPDPPPIDYLKGAPEALFRETTVHDFDMARFILGEEPVSLFAMASTLTTPAYQALGEVDTAVVVLRTATGKLCQINNSWRAVYGHDQRVEVLGARGMVRSANARPTTVERFDAAGSRRDPLHHFFVERYAEAYRRELDHFIDVVEGKADPLISAEDGRRALVLADAATQSARTGEAVAIVY